MANPLSSDGRGRAKNYLPRDPAARWRRAESKEFLQICRAPGKISCSQGISVASYQLGERLVIAWARWVYSSQPVPQSVLITASCVLACAISPLMT